MMLRKAENDKNKHSNKVTNDLNQKTKFFQLKS